MKYMHEEGWTTIKAWTYMVFYNIYYLFVNRFPYKITNLSIAFIYISNKNKIKNFEEGK